MEDLYLRFPDQQTAEAVLDGLDGAIDIIGTIYKPTGNVIVTGDSEMLEMAALPGWHVNTRGEATDELRSYAVEVATPFRVWA